MREGICHGFSAECLAIFICLIALLRKSQRRWLLLMGGVKIIFVPKMASFPHQGSGIIFCVRRAEQDVNRALPSELAQGGQAIRR
jgi:hypothetical protein